MLLFSFVIVGLMDCGAKENFEPAYHFLFLWFDRSPAYLTASPGMSQLGWNWMEWPLTIFQITLGKSNFWRRQTLRSSY